MRIMRSMEYKTAGVEDGCGTGIKQQNLWKRINQFADAKQLKIDLSQDVLEEILRYWNRRVYGRKDF